MTRQEVQSIWGRAWDIFIILGLWIYCKSNIKLREHLFKFMLNYYLWSVNFENIILGLQTMG